MKVIERRDYSVPAVMRRNCDRCASLLEFGREETQQRRGPDGVLKISVWCPVCDYTSCWDAPK